MRLGHGYTRIHIQEHTGRVAAMLAIAVGKAGSLAASDGKHRSYAPVYSQALDVPDVLKRIRVAGTPTVCPLQDGPIAATGGMR